MDEEWLTYQQAADLLDCHTSRIAKLIRRGDLHTRSETLGYRPRAGSIRRTDVDQIAAADARRDLEQTARRAELDEAAAARLPPDDDHEWISIPEAARQLGRTDKAVLARIHRDRLPATRVGRRWWIRQDQLTLIEAGRLGTKTKRI